MNDMNTPLNPENDLPDQITAKEAARVSTVASKNTKPRKRTKRDTRVIISRCILRVLVVLLTTICLIIGAAWILLDSIFNGPSQYACELLTMSLANSSGTWWMPAFFMGEERAAQIIAGDQNLLPPDTDFESDIVIDHNAGMQGNNDEWKDYPDGIRIETYRGDTFTAHIMIIRDASSVSLATSYQYSNGNGFSTNLPGQRITDMMQYTGAIAGINAGAFYDDGTSNPIVGSVPHGLVVSNGNIVWTSGQAPFRGFVGFNESNDLIVSTSMTAAKAKELKIRDGCEFGPVLIVNGVVNEEAYNNESGVNPRTAIGQRVDGAVIMVCIDGRQAGSLGGSFADMIDIMIEYGAVNACNLDGGSSSVMMYRDTYGRYGDAGNVMMVNSYSLLQENPRVMPTFFLVMPSNED